MDREPLFRELFDTHYRAVASYVLSRGYQAADADDLIAATFEVAWRRLDAVPAGRDAVPWLLTVARNLSRNARRKSVREQTLMEQLASEPAPPPIAAGADDGSTDEPMLQALQALKPLDRELILLIAWDDLTPAEAGRVLGLAAVTARSRLHRARQRLAVELNPTLLEPERSR